MRMIEKMTAQRLDLEVNEFAGLLQDAVAGGASVGFLAPLGREEARMYWRGVARAMTAGHRILLAAREDDELVGGVQLDLAVMPNALHRAEVMKLLVLSRVRRRGIGRELMNEIEVQAREEGRTLLVLDTRQGDPAERLYLSLGYQRAGGIPRYAASPGGELHETTILYRELK